MKFTTQNYEKKQLKFWSNHFLQQCNQYVNIQTLFVRLLLIPETAFTNLLVIIWFKASL